MDSKEKGRKEEEESSHVPKELIQVDPSELSFPFLQNAVLSVSQVAHLKCGRCRVKLMYTPGASSVGCFTCHYNNPVRGKGSFAPKSVYVVPRELIQVDPGELSFSFLPNEVLSAWSTIKLVNVTEDYVVFLPIRMENNVAEYITRPYGGILPPRSTQEFLVRRVARKSVAHSMKCDDKYLVYSTSMSKSLSNFKCASDLTKLYEKLGGQIWHKRELGVILYPAYQHGSPSGKPHTEIELTLDRMPLKHLKDITNNFSSERILGRGGSGVVYKGVLRNGTMVAVKKLVQSMSSSQEQFENEVNLLMRLKHQNIVRLVGYCYETQHLQSHYEGKFIFSWNTECLLCLEYLPMGSLDKYISDASSGLDWPTRLKIIEGISYGLQYLHEQPDGPIIHLDLKPANIMLEENIIPKITDFGLSRLLDQKQTMHTAINSGTLGYMPPEFLRGIITPMSDIFALGVIIMEVIRGHRDYPYDIRTSSTKFIELELQRWRNVLQKEPGYTSLAIDCQQITRCIQIGLICVNPVRTKRPTMKKIIDMLQGLESIDWYISNESSNPSIQAEAP